MSRARTEQEPHRDRWLGAHRTELGRGRSKVRASFEGARLQINVIRAVLALELGDEIGDVELLIDLAHAGRHRHAYDTVDHVSLDGLAPASAAHDLDG